MISARLPQECSRYGRPAACDKAASLLASEHVNGDFLRADQRTGPVAHVIGGPDHLDAWELQHAGHRDVVHRDELVGHGLHEIGLVVEQEAGFS